MSRHFLNFPDTDILLFQGVEKDSKLPLDLDLFPDDGIEDPFSYREDSLSSPSGGTPESSLHLPLSSSTSPDRFFHSPDTPDSGSLSDIPSLDPIDSFSNLRFTMSTHDKDDYEEDLDFRAPFIPMQMDDDFPLLSPSNSVMWGPQETPQRKFPATQDRLSDSSPKPKAVVPLRETSLKSSLAALLQSDTHNSNNNKKSNNNRHNDRNNNKRWHADSKARQRNNFTPSRNYPNSGHIIMLDSVPPVKKPSPANKSQGGQQRKTTPSIGSHTSTMRVNDRLIKVQVCVSELPSAPIEQKQPFPSPPDPPPKRGSPPSHNDSPKRMKVDTTTHQGCQDRTHDSVLLNLLISGEDASRGYLCSGNSRHSENRFEPAVLSLPANDLCPQDPDGENDLLDSYLKIQYEDMLHSDELLSALDHPLLRNSISIG